MYKRQADGGRGRIYVHEDIISTPCQYSSDLTPLVRGTAGDDALGRTLLMEGDLTGDGYGDLVVCAPGWDVAGVPGAGACGVIAGGFAESDDAQLEDQVVSTIYGSRPQRNGCRRRWQSSSAGAAPVHRSRSRCRRPPP